MLPTLARPLLVVAALTAALPARVLAQPAPSAPTDALTALDREVLTAAEALAAEATQLIEQWIAAHEILEDRLFARLYFPIGKTRPQKYTTPYDALADRDLVGPEDRTLGRTDTRIYAIVTDSNGYVPAHNTRFARPLSGDTEADYLNNRTKRLLGDLTSLTAARSEAHYLLQRARLETGEPIYDLSVPVTVRGKHWGCVRIGYRRGE